MQKVPEFARNTLNSTDIKTGNFSERQFLWKKLCDWFNKLRSCVSTEKSVLTWTTVRMLPT